MLKTVAGSAACDPDVVEGRMTVDEKVAARGVLVLADARLHDR
jgi:hypothetical protein